LFYTFILQENSQVDTNMEDNSQIVHEVGRNLLYQGLSSLWGDVVSLFCER